MDGAALFSADVDFGGFRVHRTIFSHVYSQRPEARHCVFNSVIFISISRSRVDVYRILVVYLWISCHDRRPPKKVINGRYDLQTVTFRRIKNEGKIADSVPRSYMRDEGIGPSESACRRSLQTTLSCSGKEPGW